MLFIVNSISNPKCKDFPDNNLNYHIRKLQQMLKGFDLKTPTETIKKYSKRRPGKITPLKRSKN